MKKKNLFIGMAAMLCMLLLATGCPQEVDDNPSSGTPDTLVSAISIGEKNVDPLPSPASRMGDAAAAELVVSTERPRDADEVEGVYYRPVQPIVVTIADPNASVFFAVSAPGEYPATIELPGTPEVENTAMVKRNISITSRNDYSFPIGQVVWIKVISGDESKTAFYKITVTSPTHDTAVNSIKVNGNDVLEMNQSGHIGVWNCGASWGEAVAGLVNISSSQAAAPLVAVAARNNEYDLAKPRAEYAKIPSGTDASAEPSVWTSESPASFANNDILAVRITASNGKTAGYLKITIKVGGNAFLSGLTVNDIDINLGNPSASINAVEGAYRVTEYADLSAAPVNWTVVPTPEDSDAAVTWAIAAKGVIPDPQDFTSPTSFDTSHNYLFIKVVSGSGDSTMYYHVIYDERPKDTEHILSGGKSVPIYKFTIPDGKTWADLGEHPVVKMRIYMEEDEIIKADGFHRHFGFGELQRCNPSWSAANKANFLYPLGASGFDAYMPFLFNINVRQLAIDPVTGTPTPGSAAANMWFTILYQLTELEDDKQPWNPNTDFDSQPASYNPDTRFPLPGTTGDVYFGLGITHDEVKEYWVKEISIESDDGSFKIFCNLLGDGRIDATTGNGNGFARVSTAQGGLIRELVSDPSLK